MQTALVEPNVSMGQLVTETLKDGLIPAVVPSLPDISVGGAFAGTAAGSSSHKYGHFDETVNWIEVVLGNGDTVQASSRSSDNQELLRLNARALGTLGIVTLLEVQLVPSDKYVKLEYHLFTSATEALEQIALLSTTEFDFLDGIMFNDSRGMLMAGRLVSEREPRVPIVGFSQPADRWFFAHVHGKAKCPRGKPCITCSWTKHSFQYKQKGGPTTELIPIYDYLFRFDRGSHWLAAYNWPTQFWNRISRRLMESMFKSDFSSRAFQLSDASQTSMIQNLEIPPESTVDILQFLDSTFKIYPLWLCPIKHTPWALMHSSSDSTRNQAPATYFINIGVYGAPDHGKKPYTRNTQAKFTQHNRAIERRVEQAGGFKWLNGPCFYDESSFQSICDTEKYHQSRQKWNATTLPYLLDKITDKTTENGGKTTWKGVSAGRAFLQAAVKKNVLLQ